MQVQCVLYNMPLVLNMAACCLLPVMLYTVAFTIGYYAYVCRCRCRCVQVQCACAVAGVQVQLQVCTLFSYGHFTLGFFLTIYQDFFPFLLFFLSPFFLGGGKLVSFA